MHFWSSTAGGIYYTPHTEGRHWRSPIQQFIEQITQSGLIPADELSAFVDALPAERKADAEQLARELVRQKRLTAFQAQQIYQGKGKHLVLGNYVALDKRGQGGMGMVLKAEHRRMKRLVAPMGLARRRPAAGHRAVRRRTGPRASRSLGRAPGCAGRVRKQHRHKFVLMPPGEFTMGSTPAEIEEAMMLASSNEDWKKLLRANPPGTRWS
jgi:hypothetical protein